MQEKKKKKGLKNSPGKSDTLSIVLYNKKPGSLASR